MAGRRWLSGCGKNVRDMKEEGGRVTWEGLNKDGVGTHRRVGVRREDQPKLKMHGPGIHMLLGTLRGK